MFNAIAISDRHAVHATETGGGIHPVCGTRLAGAKPTAHRNVSCKRCLQVMGKRATEAATEIRAQRAALLDVKPAPGGFGGQTYRESMRGVVDQMTAAVTDYVEVARCSLFSEAMAQPCGDDKRPVLVAVPMSGRTGDVMVGGVTVALLHQDRESGLWTVEELGGKLIVNGAPYAESAVRAWALVTGITSPVDVLFREVRNSA